MGLPQKRQILRSFFDTRRYVYEEAATIFVTALNVFLIGVRMIFLPDRLFCLLFAVDAAIETPRRIHQLEFMD